MRDLSYLSKIEEPLQILIIINELMIQKLRKRNINVFFKTVKVEISQYKIMIGLPQKLSLRSLLSNCYKVKPLKV